MSRMKMNVQPHGENSDGSWSIRDESHVEMLAGS